MLFTETTPYAPSSPYSANRDMNYYNDVYDWLGGYPYESISPEECKQLFIQLWFMLESTKIQLMPRGIGLFGSCCDDYTFSKAV